MAQSKTHSLYESVINTVIGLIISFIAQVIIFSSMEINVSYKQNILITMIFFVLSFVRGYVIRRIFNKIGDAKDENIYLKENATEYIQDLALIHNITESEVLNSIVLAHALQPLNNSKISSN
jgi:hypothetical protein